MTKIEDKMIEAIDFMRRCKDDIEKWKKIIEKPTYTTNLKLQAQAAILARGIHLKMESLFAIDEFDRESPGEFLFKLGQHIMRFEDLYHKQQVVASPQDDDSDKLKEPKPSMNMKALKDAIERGSKTK